ncbi:hypothetical protein DPQ22_01485 [Candidatus Tokpelaia sp.]|nr:hypothetical protein DPQ22_01485 [Candidatus Tokpelaia sp.]
MRGGLPPLAPVDNSIATPICRSTRLSAAFFAHARLKLRTAERRPIAHSRRTGSRSGAEPARHRKYIALCS